MEDLLKVNELAEKLRLSRATIYRLKDQGLPFIKIGGSIFFNFDDVIAWINKQNN